MLDKIIAGVADDVGALPAAAQAESLTAVPIEVRGATIVPLITGKGCYTVLLYLNDQSAAKLVGPIQLK